MYVKDICEILVTSKDISPHYLVPVTFEEGGAFTVNTACNMVAHCGSVAGIERHESRGMCRAVHE